MEVAELIAGGFTHTGVKTIALHPPGFLNFSLTDDAIKELAKQMSEQKKTFFKLYEKPTQNSNLEFVSANPTGPLHVGHGRGAIIGDVLAKVLNFSGQQATREYYVNNAGEQMKKLANSLRIRCQQVLGEQIDLPENAYHGEYLAELAQTLVQDEGASVLDKDDQFFADYAEKHLLTEIKETLELYGVTFDVWFPETKLHSSGEIAKALDILHEKGYLYEKDGATWFKATEFGDDKDRVVVKADGIYTYAAADIAYMLDKVDRGFNHLVMILGHDHHSYLMRLKCIQKALGIQEYPLDVILYQLVKMKQSGQQVRMSKRAGNIVTLRDVIQAVGKDVARFFFLNRKADAQLEFDIDLAMKKTEENPVFYVQYAQFIGTEEALLLKKMAALRSILQTICRTHQTHLLTYYVLELANIFHNYYAHNRVIDESDVQRSRGRLLLISILKDTFETVLELLGISRPDKM